MSDASSSAAHPDPRYVAARRVLLDALQALAPQAPAAILAGAQAVYLRTGDTDLAVAPSPLTATSSLTPPSSATTRRSRRRWAALALSSRS